MLTLSGCKMKKDDDQAVGFNQHLPDRRLFKRHNYLPLLISGALVPVPIFRENARGWRAAFLS